MPIILPSAAVVLGALDAPGGGSKRQVVLLAAAQRLLQSIDVLLGPADLAESSRIDRSLRVQFDDASWDEAWAEGQAMTLEQAIAFALDTPG